MRVPSASVCAVVVVASPEYGAPVTIGPIAGSPAMNSTVDPADVRTWTVWAAADEATATSEAASVTPAVPRFNLSALPLLRSLLMVLLLVRAPRARIERLVPGRPRRRARRRGRCYVKPQASRPRGHQPAPGRSLSARRAALRAVPGVPPCTATRCM